MLFLKHLLFLKIVPKPSNFCSGFPSLSLVDFLHCTFMAGFQNNFEDHMRLSEQLLVSQAAIGKPEQARLIGLLEGLFLFVSDFIEASRNFSLDFLHRKTDKIVKTIRAHLKILFLFLGPSKNIHLVTLSLHLRERGVHTKRGVRVVLKRQ
jgi:hypothetical protein